ncbi:MAG: hypothetical protein PHO48_00495 [Candidatus Gracilibacteria bacterium]|jgi:hypothetical protein|nr:hypothetical protein [Candidatus Gracilibacteria bacterium]MDD5178743.1 hypothetical protein [Candidatus Gracilibacteria bacterium]
MSKTTKTKTTRAATRISTKRVHFAINPIRNANPRGYRTTRKSGVFARIFSL